MRRYIGLLIALSITVLLGSTVPTGQALSEPNPDEPQPGSDKTAFAPGRILVKVKDSAPADAIVSVNRRNDARPKEKIPHSRLSVVDLPKGLSVTEAVERYEASPEVEYAEPDYELHPAVSAPTPNDPSFPKMYDLYNRGQYGGTFDADIDGPEAWNATTGAADTVVAIIDTGVDVNHPDLRDNIWVNPDETPGNNKDDDHNGYIDDVNGWDFYHDDATVYDAASEDRHGTLVAGTIAAEGNNSLGVTGVNWQASIMPLKFLGPKTGYTSDVVEAINYAVNNGVKISNNSWGGGPFSQAILDAINAADQKDHLFVASAGNGGTDGVGDDSDATPHYPSNYNSPNVVSVAASNHHDNLTSFSNYGATSVDLAAPGLWGYSTLPGNTYDFYSGTSMAAPHVTGVAALIKSQDPQLSDTAIKTRILESVDEITSLQGKLVTGGRLNAAKALGENTAPLIVGLHPSRKKLHDRTPIISATVQDDETDLTGTQIQLYVDGRLKRSFSYDQVEDKLTYRSRRLALRRHRVQVVVDDGQGLQETRTWKFRVVSRR